MADAAPQHEEVPDSVIEQVVRAGIKEDTGRVEAVSYTHLDVYKRQVRTRPT